MLVADPPLSELRHASPSNSSPAAVQEMQGVRDFLEFSFSSLRGTRDRLSITRE